MFVVLAAVQVTHKLLLIHDRAQRRKKNCIKKRCISVVMGGGGGEGWGCWGRGLTQEVLKVDLEPEDERRPPAQLNLK